MTTFDNVSSGSSTSSTTVTVSHTVGSGSNRVLIVDGILGMNPDTDTLSATYGGVGMTSIGVRHSNDQTAGKIERFVLIAPASGTANVVVTKTGGTTDVTMIAGCMSFSDASQTIGDYVFTSAVGEGTTASVTETGTASGSIIAFAAIAGVSMSASSQTDRWIQNVNTSSAAGNGRGATADGTGGNVTCTFTVSVLDWWAAVATEILSQVGAAAVQMPRAVIVAG